MCACGKWVCTSDNCSGGGKGENLVVEQESKRKINNLEYGTTESESGVDIGSRYDEEADNEEEDPEDDPDVQDIRWF